MPVNRKEKLSQLICDYLKKHPDAGDTLEGITQWWLELGRIDTSMDEVASILNDLVEKGIIEIYKNKGGTNLYKIGVVTRSKDRT